MDAKQLSSTAFAIVGIMRMDTPLEFKIEVQHGPIISFQADRDPRERGHRPPNSRR